MIQLSVLYVLPTPKFFAEGPGGRVTHATGVVTGLADNGVTVHVLSGPGTEAHLSTTGPSAATHEVETAGVGWWTGLRWSVSLLKRLSAILNGARVSHVLVRYAVSKAMFFVPLIWAFSSRIWVFEVNSLALHQLHGLPYSMRRVYFTFERWILSQADLVYVVSTALKEDLISGKRGLPKHKVVVIPNGGPDPLWNRVQPSGPDESVRFVYLGVFHGYYELPLVLEAFRELRAFRPAVELHFYGDGPNRTELEKSSQGVEGLFFHGQFDLSSLLSEGRITERDILLLPYGPHGLARIHSPIKLYEYMALGLAIIASSVGQITEVLEDGRTAKLYNQGEKESLVEAMVWLADSEAARRSLMKNVRKEYSASLTWKARMESLLSYMEEASTGKDTL
jgi:glycosyltransferase involved in cell wall biosynthesis